MITNSRTVATSPGKSLKYLLNFFCRVLSGGLAEDGAAISESESSSPAPCPDPEYPEYAEPAKNILKSRKELSTFT